MSRKTRRVGTATAILACGVLALACESSPTETALDLSPSMEIVDGAHQGNERFFFLAPLVKDPTVGGVFDATASPIVDICRLGESVCAPVIATYSTTAGTGGELVTVDPVAEHYSVNWHTSDFELDQAATYRIVVSVAATELGHADVDVVSGGNELKSVDTGEYIPLKDGRTLPIKFRIEEGAVFVVGAGGGVIADPDGEVTLAIPDGALAADVGITIEPTVVSHPEVSAFGTPYDFGPDGTVFDEPVGLTLTFDPAALPQGVEPSMLTVKLDLEDGTFEEIRGTTIDGVAGTATASIDHFSTYFVGEGTDSVEILLDGADFAEPVVLFPGEAVELKVTPYVKTKISPTTGEVVEEGKGTSTRIGIKITGDASLKVGTASYGETTIYTVHAVSPGGAVVYLSAGDYTVPVSFKVVSAVDPPSHQRVAANGDHSCAIRGGVVQCWGNNDVGMLGDGTTEDRTVPVDVALPAEAVDVVTYADGSCAIDTDGLVWCWGHHRALGTGATAPSPTPVPVKLAGLVAVKLTAGMRHVCALSDGGGIACWGDNSDGQLGDGTTTPRPTPTWVQRVSSFVAVSAGALYTCALDASGQAWCWGSQTNGALGDGQSSGSRPTPGPVSSAERFRALEAGNSRACATTEAGVPHCWGAGQNPGGSVPAPIDTGHDFHWLSIGSGFSCGVEAGTGASYCWGLNSSGQLGDGTTTNRHAASIPVATSLVFEQIAGESAHACGITAADEVACWGRNTQGQAGIGSSGPNVLVPKPVASVPLPAFVGLWGETDAFQFGKLWNPYGLSLDRNENLLVNGSMHRIDAFTPDGTHLYSLGSLTHGSEPGEFWGIRDSEIAYDAVSGSDVIYVADAINHRVQKLTPGGSFLAVLKPATEFYQPVGIGVDEADNVYALSQNRQKVVKFAPDGSVLTEWGTLGSAPGQFANPFGIDVAGAHVYVADGANHRVQKFDLDGTFVSTWGVRGSRDGEFETPYDVEIDVARGLVYVADSGNLRVQVFDLDGGFLGSVVPDAATPFQSPRGLTVDSEGRLYVSDFTQHRIYVFEY